MVVSTKTCDEAIENAEKALEKNFKGFKSAKEAITQKGITEPEIFKGIKTLKDPKDINAIIFAKAQIYIDNKEFSKAEDFLEKAVKEIRDHPSLSATDKSKMIQDLNKLSIRYGEVKLMYAVENMGSEWSKISDFQKISKYHIIEGNKIYFINDKKIVGIIPIKRRIGNNIIQLIERGTFAYDDGKNILPIVGNLDDVGEEINKFKGKEIAIFSRDLNDQNVQYLNVGGTIFKKERTKIGCIKNCR